MFVVGERDTNRQRPFQRNVRSERSAAAPRPSGVAQPEEARAGAPQIEPHGPTFLAAPQAKPVRRGRKSTNSGNKVISRSAMMSGMIQGVTARTTKPKLWLEMEDNT